MALWLIRRAAGLLRLAQRWYGPQLDAWHIDDDVKLAVKILRYAAGDPSGGGGFREWNV